MPDYTQKRASIVCETLACGNMRPAYHTNNKMVLVLTLAASYFLTEVILRMREFIFLVINKD